MTTLPVVGVPVKSRALNGLDSLLSIVQSPRAFRGHHGDQRFEECGADRRLDSRFAGRGTRGRLEAFRAKQTADVLKAEL